MKKYGFSLLCLAGLLGSVSVTAQIADGGLQVAAEHARIDAERQRIEKRFAEEEAACFQKFAVNDCRDASRARRRVDMADLRRQEIALNDAERKRKGAEQLQRMEEAAAAKDAPPVAVGTATPRTPATPAPMRPPSRANRTMLPRPPRRRLRARPPPTARPARRRKTRPPAPAAQPRPPMNPRATPKSCKKPPTTRPTLPSAVRPAPRPRRPRCQSPHLESKCSYF